MIDFTFGVTTVANRALKRVAGTRLRWAQTASVAGAVRSGSELAERMIAHYRDGAVAWHEDHTEAMAAEIEATLRGPRSLWPSRSGASREAFRATPVGKDEIAVRNELRHVHILNDSGVVRGSPNPHYLAAQRTVYDDWRGIKERAGAVAGGV